jgi:predicted SpoU family rRNA methylase
VGENKVNGKVINSTQYEKHLLEILSEAQERGEDIMITIGYEK